MKQGTVNPSTKMNSITVGQRPGLSIRNKTKGQSSLACAVFVYEYVLDIFIILFWIGSSSVRAEQ